MSIKKIIISGIIFIVSLGLLTSCSSFRFNLLSRDEEAISDEVFEKIVDSLKNKENDSLKDMFSANVLKEAKDIDDDINYLRGIFKGDIISKTCAIESSDSKNDGNMKTEIKSKYTVTTNEDTYIVFFINNITDTIDKNNVGLYMLQIIKESDIDSQFDWGGPSTRCSGIYIPISK